jgi:undecaprenyl-diphosphatase
MTFLNEQIFFWFYHFAHQSAIGDTVIIFFAETLPLLLLIGITLGTLVYGFRRHVQSGKLICLRCYEHFTIIVGVALFARLLAEVVKVLAHAARPFITFAGKVVPLVQESGFSSFPSGHATLMFALALGVYSYNRRWGIVMFAFAFLISAARIVAGVHYPLDILVGALLGLFISGIVLVWDKSMVFPQK